MKKQLRIPRVVISAPQGRSGKTTVSMVLIGALVHAGFTVQPFKKGPDFIDPSWLSLASGRPCRNLDAFLMKEETIKESVFQAASGADVAIIEGAMGLFDGADLAGSGSTAQIAKILGAPVIMVVDCHRMTRSIAALVKGFQEFDPRINVAGVILNNVARPRHQEMLTAAVEKYCSLPVLGALSKNPLWAIPDRHLGLIPAGEEKKLQEALEAMRRTTKDIFRFQEILKIARQAPVLTAESHEEMGKPVQFPVKVGIIRDRSFSFYYPENLESLEQAGAKLIFIDALETRILPEIDAMFIGGGFPEVFSRSLAENVALRRLIAQKIEDGLPVYAECGGLMYLGRSIIHGEQHFPMVGVLPFDAVVKGSPQGHGYTLMDVQEENPFFAKDSSLQGHEFHHSCLVNLDLSRAKFAYAVRRGQGIDGKRDGILYKNVLASYHHIHALGTPEWAENFVRSAQRFRQSQIPELNVSRVREKV